MEIKQSLNGKITTKELANILGISRDGAAKLRRRHGLGEFLYGMWWLSPDDVERAKQVSRTFIHSNR